MDNRSKEKILVDTKKIVDMIFSRKCTKNTYNDIILSNFITKKDIVTMHKTKTLQMKMGEVWQSVIGSIDGITNLKSGHVSKLDLLSEKYKFVMELKNAHNTCNSSSRAKTLDQLADFKQRNIDYEVIYAYVNCNTVGNVGKDEIITHNSQKIRILSGNKLLTYLFGGNINIIINAITESLKDFL